MKLFSSHIRIVTLTFILISLLIISCSKKDICSNSEKAKLKNYTGFDGCGWVIELNDEVRLEPINLSNFDIELKDGKKVWISFHEVYGASICMVGPIIEIDCIIER